MLLVIFLTGAILWNLPWSKYENVFLVSAVEPGYLDFDNLPDTNFSCEGKVIGGYYADVETGCQMFHVCTIGQKSEITDIKFLCLNGTVFDQETRVCERLDEVDCSKSESFFDLNLELYGNNGGGYGIQPEDETPPQDGEQANCDDEYEDDGSCKKVEPNQQKPNVMDIQEEIEYDWEEINTALSTTPATKPAPTTTQSTTTTKQVTTSLRPSSTPPPSKFHYRPEIVPISTTTPNTVLQLLALHEAFQENLKRRDPLGKFPTSGLPAPKTTSPRTLPISHAPYQLSNAAQSHFITNSNKLPNSLSNLSQNNQFSNLTPNRNPPHSVYKAESVNNFFNKQPSQKVPNKTVANHSPIPTSSTNQNVEPLYAYKILANDVLNRYRQPSKPSAPVAATAPVYKMEAAPQFAHSTFTIAQNKPYVLRSKMSLEKDTDTESETDDEIEEQATPQKLENFSHSNFARAIPDRHSNPKNVSDSVSVVLTTSSVSSSISSKPRSAISSNTNSITVSNSSKNSNINNSSNALSTKSKESPLQLIQPNITDIKSLNDESYYEEARTDYDDNSQEYKDILYQTDVQKIKQ